MKVVWNGFLLALLFVSVSAFSTPAELDRDVALTESSMLEGSVILREDIETGELAVVQVEDEITSEEGWLELAEASEFVAVPGEHMSSEFAELDGESGGTSWVVWRGGYGWGYGYSYSYGYRYGYNYNWYRPVYSWGGYPGCGYYNCRRYRYYCY
jgi:hypothetical protein